MFGLFRRKPEFADFAAPSNPHSQRQFLKARNAKICSPKDFERTISERIKPSFTAEIAESQSLKSARKGLIAKDLAGRSFKGGRK